MELGFKKFEIEGIPLYRFNHLELAASAPANLAIDALVELGRLTFSVKDVSLNHIPSNAICYLFHSDIFLAMASVKVWNEFLNSSTGPKAAYLGYHGILSYMGSLPFMRRPFIACRYHLGSKVRPFDQILNFLDEHEGRFFMRTDAGGPYGSVKGSLVKLSRETGRPLVPIRQFADKCFTINHHVVPLPFSKITSKIGRVIHPEEIQSLPNEAALNLLQMEMDKLQT